MRIWTTLSPCFVRAAPERSIVQISDRINLSFATALVVDDNVQALELMCSVLNAFGLKQITRAEGGTAAMELIQRQSFDLVVTDAQMPQVDGYELVRWMRQLPGDAVRMTPALVTTAHTRRPDVARARDCGANFIVAKPISPKVILERLYWIGKGTRPFVICDAYVGPDRRFRQAGPPVEFPDGRRDSDLGGEVSSIAGENLTQDELSAVVAPQRAEL